jgi:hypothetical protein
MIHGLLAIQPKTISEHHIYQVIQQIFVSLSQIPARIQSIDVWIAHCEQVRVLASDAPMITPKRVITNRKAYSPDCGLR